MPEGVAPPTLKIGEPIIRASDVANATLAGRREGAGGGAGGGGNGGGKPPEKPGVAKVERGRRPAESYAGVGAEHTGKEVNPDKKTKAEIVRKLRWWAEQCVDEDGELSNVGELDRHVLSLFKTIANIPAGTPLTKKVINGILGKEARFAGSVIGPREVLDYDKLEQPQEMELHYVLNAMERALAVALGAEITQYPAMIDKTPHGVGKITVSLMNVGAKAIGGFISGRYHGALEAVVGHLGETGENIRSGWEKKKIMAEYQEGFKGTALGETLNSAGLQAFLGNQTPEQQIRFAVELRSARRALDSEIYKFNRRDPLLDRPDVSLGKSIKLVMQRPEYKGLDYETLEEGPIKQQVEFEAYIIQAYQHATDKTKEMIDNRRMEKYKPERLAKLEEVIDRFGGGKAGKGSEARDFEERERKYRDLDEDVKTKEKQLKRDRAKVKEINSKRAKAERSIKRKEEYYERLSAGKVKKVKDPTTVMGRLDLEIDKLEKFINDLEDTAKIQERIDTAEVPLERKRAERDKAKKEWDKIRGKLGGEEAEKKLEALLAVKRLIVAEEGSEPKYKLIMANLMDRDDVHLDRLGTDRKENWTEIKSTFGVLGDEFNDIVGGTDNLNIRVFLARALGIKIDTSKIKVKTKAGEIMRNDVDDEIVRYLKLLRARDPQLINLYSNLVETILSSALTGEPTLDYLPGTVVSKPDIEITTPPKGKVGRERQVRLHEIEEKRRVYFEEQLVARGYTPGVNTAVEYVRLENGRTIALVVGKDGRNQVFEMGDKEVRTLGSMETFRTDSATGALHQLRATTPEAAGIQSGLESVIGLRFIDSQLQWPAAKVSRNPARGIREGFQFTTGANPLGPDITVYMIQDAAGFKVYKAVRTPAGGTPQETSYSDLQLDEFLRTEGQDVARVAALTRVAGMEKKGADLVGRDAKLGKFSSRLEDERYGNWNDEVGSTPTDRFGFDIDLTDKQGPLISLTRSSVITGPLGVKYSKRISTGGEALIDGPMAPANAIRRDRLTEAAFYHFQALSPEKKRQLIGKFRNIQITWTTGLPPPGGPAVPTLIEIGLNRNGELVLRDRSDPRNANPEEHDAFDYLNNNLASGRLTTTNIEGIKRAIGVEYFKTLNRMRVG